MASSAYGEDIALTVSPLQNLDTWRAPKVSSKGAFQRAVSVMPLLENACSDGTADP